MGRELPSDWSTRRRKAIERDDYECQNCGRKGGEKGHHQLHVHHIVPRNSKGRHKLSNLKTVCHQCHKAIHNEEIDAPTEGDQSWSEIYKRFVATNTCPVCRQRALNDSSGLKYNDLGNFLQYEKWPREYVFPEDTGLIRCSNCGTAFELTHEEGYGAVNSDDDLMLEAIEYSEGSRFAYYGIVAGVIFSSIAGLILSFSTETIPYLIFTAWLLLTVSIYSDNKYVRHNSTVNPDSRIWVLTPLLGIYHWLLIPIVGLVYLAYRYEFASSNSTFYQARLRERFLPKSVGNDRAVSKPEENKTRNQVSIQKRLDEVTERFDQLVNTEIHELGEHISSGARFLNEMSEGNKLPEGYVDKYSNLQEQAQKGVSEFQVELVKFQELPNEHLSKESNECYESLVTELYMFTSKSEDLIDISQDIIEEDVNGRSMKINTEVESEFVRVQQEYLESAQLVSSEIEELDATLSSNQRDS